MSTKVSDKVKMKKRVKATPLHVREFKHPNNELAVLIHYRSGRFDNKSQTDPAIQAFFDDGKVKSYEFWTRGVPHRDDGLPQFEEVYPSGALKEAKWIVNGKLHRVNAPASVRYYENGKAQTLRYWQKDMPHRPHKEGPAYQSFREDGQPDEVLYIEWDKLHRPQAEGPARIKYKYSQSGELVETIEEFWENHKKVGEMQNGKFVPSLPKSE